jgi:GcrA cell cycle regulator
LTFISEYQKLMKASGGVDIEQGPIVEPTNWAPEHSDALRKLIAERLSFSEIAAAINKQFKTSYSRNATLGRARRMGLAGPARPEEPSGVSSWLNRLGERRPAKLKPPGLRRAMPSAFEGTEAPKLRCVGIEPRRLSLIQLEHGDCRYPYGGDEEGEVITFCGHPRRPGSSYCTPHFHLSRGPGTPSERAAHIVLLRVIEAA